MELLPETVPDAHVWWRIADPGWVDPLDSSFAQRHGGRWNPPGSFPALYLNEDLVTAHLNLRTFIARWPYEPEDLRDDTGPLLVGCVLPRRQVVCEAHSPAGVRAADLPETYPFGEDGAPVPSGTPGSSEWPTTCATNMPRNGRAVASGRVQRHRESSPVTTAG